MNLSKTTRWLLRIHQNRKRQLCGMIPQTSSTYLHLTLSLNKQCRFNQMQIQLNKVIYFWQRTWVIHGVKVEINLNKTIIQVVDLNQPLTPGCSSNQWTNKTWWWVVAEEWEWTQCNNNKWWWCVSNRWIKWINKIKWWDKAWAWTNLVEWDKWTRWIRWVIIQEALTTKWIWVDNKWEWECSNNKWASMAKTRWTRTWWEVTWVEECNRIWECQWIKIKIIMHLGLWTSEEISNFEI